MTVLYQSLCGLMISCSAGCGVLYRRITEYDDSEPSQRLDQIPSQRFMVSKLKFGQSPFPHIAFGPALPEEPDSGARCRKRKAGNIDDNDISLFKRVRMVSRKKRVRKPPSRTSPFTTYAGSRGSFNPTGRDVVNEH